ncbi:hypothetical protein [Nodosilinea sp. P-1105]|uniref:hypothetical protein n=1 Tax=Nodosilinea sp. P-1105 TaxID=2546229 RepID=UPI00146E8B5F|nr:hypothetical protein [Nodosilinea sp. P-1105]NMF86022.1 hypothetical protein [Nodosilinea sp. P-1105]
MSFLKFPVRSVIRRLTLVLLAGMIWLLSSLYAPAYAENSPDVERYIAADGTDLTAVAQCLPKQLSQGNLARVLRESQNDFLEKVFDVKDNYSDYKLDDSEVEYLACLESKGFVSQVNR